MAGYKQYFKGKKITVMGLGLLGRGVGDTAFLSEMGADLIVTDLKTEAELKKSLDELKGYENITYVLGEHRLEDFTDRDMILKSAGVPLDSPYIEAARAHNVPIKMSASLVAELSPATIVGVTGTRGKSTVTQLIHHILKGALRQNSGQTGKRVFLGGNVRGIATLSLLAEAREGDIVVMELDSWQLQGFGDAKVSPHIAVFTNLKADHLNYYPDEKTYFNDKANIFRYQKEGDILIAGQHVTNTWIKAARPPIDPIVPSPIPKDWKLKIFGEHNMENAAFAVEACRAIGISEDDIEKGVESFSGVEGRLQYVKKVNGVGVYNDNNATTPDATAAGLAALATEGFSGKIVLILGGADKTLDLSMLAGLINEETFVSSIVLLPGTGSEKLKPLLQREYIEAPSLTDAVHTAIDLARGTGVILFSPAFASFGMFKNEYDRNDQFLKIVDSL